MPDNRIRRGFYQEYAEQRSREKQDAQLKRRYHVSAEKPLIVQNTSAGVRFLIWLTEAAKLIFKIMLYVLLFGLASIGLTALLNEPIRAVFLQTFQGLFH